MNKYIKNYGYLTFQRYNDESTALFLSPDKTYSSEARMVSVNIRSFNSNRFFNVDINNFPKAEKILQDNNIAYPTGESVKSGWVTYPVYELTDEAFEEFNRQINRYGV